MARRLGPSLSARRRACAPGIPGPVPDARSAGAAPGRLPTALEPLAHRLQAGVLQSPMEASAADDAASSEHSGCRRILVVDDEVTIRNTLAELLEIEGYRVDTARDGWEALRQLRQVKPDAMLLDLMMPELDGWGVLRACRADPMLADLRVIVMSARLDAAQSVAGFDVTACLTKPFDVDELLDALDKTWKVGTRCSTCDGPNPGNHVRVFVEGARTEDWALCTACWQLVQTGFRRLRRDRPLADYLGRAAFSITDSELLACLRFGEK